MAKVQKTVKGIRLSIDPRAFNDIRATKQIYNLMRDNEDTSNDGLAKEAVSKSDALDELADMLFGDDLDSIQGKLRERNDGFLEQQDWVEFVMAVIEAYQKNANTRPAPERA